MPETETVITAEQTQQAATPFGPSSWTEVPPANTADKNDQPQNSINPTVPTATTTATPTEDIPKEWLKKYFDTDDPEVIKNDREELKKIKSQPAQTPAEIKYANEQSKKFHEALIAGKEDDVYNYLHQKRTIEKLTGSEINNLSAADIIKYNIQQRNNSLTKDEVDFLFNKKFAIPPQPVREITDTDEDYNSRISDWQKQVKLVEQELVIEAKMAIPEIQKLKNELILPEIQKQADPQIAEAQQKELERVGQLRTAYLTGLEKDYKNFSGFDVKYKDEEVEIPVNFAISEEDRTALKAELESFDLDGFIQKRWWDNDTPNITQMMRDILLLRNEEKILQKVANEVGSKMRDHYIKIKGNIHVNGNQSQTFQPNQQNGAGRSPFAADAWSETPPVITQN